MADENAMQFVEVVTTEQPGGFGPNMTIVHIKNKHTSRPIQATVASRYGGGIAGPNDHTDVIPLAPGENKFAFQVMKSSGISVTIVGAMFKG